VLGDFVVARCVNAAGNPADQLVRVVGSASGSPTPSAPGTRYLAGAPQHLAPCQDNSGNTTGRIKTHNQPDVESKLPGRIHARGVYRSQDLRSGPTWPAPSTMLSRWFSRRTAGSRNSMRMKAVIQRRLPRGPGDRPAGSEGLLPAHGQLLPVDDAVGSGVGSSP